MKNHTNTIYRSKIQNNAHITQAASTMEEEISEDVKVLGTKINHLVQQNDEIAERLDRIERGKGGKGGKGKGKGERKKGDHGKCDREGKGKGHEHKGKGNNNPPIGTFYNHGLLSFHTILSTWRWIHEFMCCCTFKHSLLISNLNPFSPLHQPGGCGERKAGCGR
jgi:hypothetical protein